MTREEIGVQSYCAIATRYTSRTYFLACVRQRVLLVMQLYWNSAALDVA